MKRTLVLSLVSVVAACGGITNSDGNGGPSETDGAPVDTDASPPLPLPDPGRSLAINGDAFDVTAAALTGTGSVIVGTRRSADTGGRLGVIVEETASGPIINYVGGTLNDQLYAVASRGDEFVAVGLTRSFRGNENEDQSMVIHRSPQGLSAARYFVPTDEAFQLRAIASHGTRWVAAGRHLGGDRLTVLVAEADMTPAVARTLTVGLTGYEIRSVASDGTQIYVVGHGDDGVRRTGFVLALAGDTLLPLWARRIGAPVESRLDAASVDASALDVAGSVGLDGVHFTLDKASGQVMSANTMAERPVGGLVRDGAVLWFSGKFDDQSSWIGTIEDEVLGAATFNDVTAPTTSPMAMVADDSSATLFGTRADGAVAIPVNRTPIGACDDEPEGETLTATVSSATATLETVAVDQSPLQVSLQPLPPAAVTTGVALEESSCIASARTH